MLLTLILFFATGPRRANLVQKFLSTLTLRLSHGFGRQPKRDVGSFVLLLPGGTVCQIHSNSLNTVFQSRP